MSYRAIIFGGCFSTLVTTPSAFPDRAVAALIRRKGSDEIRPEKLRVAMNAHWSDADRVEVGKYHEYWRKTLESLGVPDVDDELIDACKLLEVEQLTSSCRPLPKMRWTLEWFKNRLRVRVGIVVNTTPTQLAHLEMWEIPQLAHTFISSNRDRMALPSTNIFNMMFSELQLDIPDLTPKECLYVDADPVNLHYARDRHFKTALTLADPETRNRQKVIEALANPQTGFDHVVYSLSELVTGTGSPKSTWDKPPI